MEKINKHNYEAFFLDYIEGNLSADQQNDLFVFLVENPELKEEFESDFGDVILTPKQNIFAKKASLKVEDESLLSLNTVDVWMIESVEGNLISSKEKELQHFVKKHKLEKTFATYHATILQPNKAEIYTDKKGLKVPVGIIIPLYVRVASIAAIGIILISVAINKLSGSDELSNSAVSKNVVYTANANKINLPLNPDINNTEDLNPEFNMDPIQNSNFANNNSDRKRNNQINTNINQNQNTQINLISFKNNEIKKEDTIKFFIVPFDVNNKDIVKNIQDSLPKNDVVIPFVDNDDVAANSTRTEQPYKLITDLASNVTNREISFSRDKDLASNEYIGYQFKLGSFEFERRK